VSASVLGFVGLLALGAAAPEVQIVHDPIGCMVAGQFPVVDATIEPLGSVARARVHFQTGLAPQGYFVEMIPQDGRLVGKLPKASLETAPIRYLVRATDTAGNTTQTQQFEVRVVPDAKGCPEGVRVAETGPPGVVVFRDGGTLDTPSCPISREHGLSAWTFHLRAGAPQKASLMVGYFPRGDGAFFAIEPGLAGGKLSVGFSQRGYCRRAFASYAAKVTLLQTWNRPWLADHGTTYFGLELSASPGFLPNLVANIGALRRVSAKRGSRDWVLTFGVGFGL
jgi:hypothetical protein